MNLIKYNIPFYKGSRDEVIIFNSENSIVGKMNRYNPNRLLHTYGRHISPKFISNINVHVGETGHVKYDIKADNQWIRFIKMGTFTIKHGNMKIGSIKESTTLGRTLDFEIDGQKYRAHTSVKKLRLITFYSVTGDRELKIASAERSLNNEMEINVSEAQELEPLLIAGISFLHTMI